MKVTIGICVRNCENSIADVLNDVLMQDCPGDWIEIIVVDDGSTDKTLDIIARFASEINHAVQVYHQSWKGISSARNVVVRNANGKYVIWVDCDMRLPPDFVRKQVGFMEKHSDVGAAKARYKFVKGGTLVEKLENTRGRMLRSSTGKLFGTGGSICRMDALKVIGGFDERIKGAGEDIDVMVRIAESNWSLSITDALFQEKFKGSWRSLWKQYYWYGYGAHYVRQKHKHSVSIFTRLPLVSLIIGFLRIFPAYRSNRMAAFLLTPVYHTYKETAWLFGFINAHIQNYGHINHQQ